MFSNDKNIETIGQLVEAIKQYIGLRGEYIKLNLVDKVVRILTIATISVIIAILLMLTLIYFSFAVAYALAPIMGHALAFGTVAAAYFIILLLCVANRKRWIERPLVRLLASILMEK